MRNTPTFFPYHAGMAYAPGPQPNSPGNSHLPWAGGFMGASASKQPWPGAVPVLHVLANNSGTPRARAPLPVVNRYAELPSDYFVINGFVGKSKG